MKQGIILGISAYFHDAAICLTVNGQLVFAIEEERLSRIKHDPSFPVIAIKRCMHETGYQLKDIDAIVFYEKPFLKFERLVDNSFRFAPKGFLMFRKMIPQWLNGKLNLRKTILKELDKIDADHGIKKAQIYFTHHHISHAASAFYPSPYNKAAFLIVDGVGEWATISIGKSNGNDFELLFEQQFPHSLGMLYSSFTAFLGFKVNNGEYKMMGLSPYGDDQSEEFKRFYDLIKNELININDDGSFTLNLSYFAFHVREKMINQSKWESLFGMTQRRPNEGIDNKHANLALAIQRITEEIMLQLVQKAKTATDLENLVMAGGIAYNSVANGKIHQSNIFNDLWIQPAAGDSGGALGAALHAYYLLNKISPDKKGAKDLMQNGMVGTAISDRFIDKYLKEQWQTQKYGDELSFYQEVAALIKQNKIIGWVQDRSEFGPRALGARSILANPSYMENKTKINSDIKKREDFRPFAPVMLKEEAEKYFDFLKAAPYMQYVAKIKEEYRIPLAENFNNLVIQEKTKIPTSKFEAVTHVDYSARLQVIENENHPLFQLLKEVKNQTGDAILLNTSFNTGGQPIVNDLEEIIDTFDSTAIDVLVINKTIIRKN
ncbi:hypothetical protein K6119_18795 [Paracrocinitomix mangrovi]|uniref:carbamoyltransferase family protein n=1 Tax=Paracrocinitomix mangrovi TaxID=2862509 RepID=UPI001C8D6D80|nr:carbamoyltransferase N-terminal domain-containing protein [Paracrocinitomix mangrovi]UKN01775.1 hypothetical protein K6119_18795 [Paracrocinitomix mangrovi]